VLEDEAESLPHRIEHRARFRAQACRSMVSVITSAAEKKKLKLSKRKQEFAPTSCTSFRDARGHDQRPCCACDINPFTAISPPSDQLRTATDCAGTKKVETTLIVNRMAYIAYSRARTQRQHQHATDQVACDHRPLQVPPVTKTPANGLTIASAP